MKIKNRNKKKQKLLQRIDKKYIGFHVYRSVNENLPFMFWERLTDEPIQDGNFNDTAAEIGQRYFYKLTQVDANGSESAPITPKTTFTDHAGNQFEQNPLVDFAGYNMYRSADKDVSLDRWERRNTEPIPTTEYKDEGVKSGEIYFYYVRTVDSKGNESAPSEIMRVIRK
ncbi:MAG: fibronectin type III domain-containing protein [Pyrinomonadaceae bacterium]